MFFHTCGVNQFWIIVFFAAVKPANNILFCIELIQRPESSLRRHKLGLTDQSICSNDDKTRFTCVHKLMTTGHSQNICRKVPDDVVLHIWQFKFDCYTILCWYTHTSHHRRSYQTVLCLCLLGSRLACSAEWRSPGCCRLAMFQWKQTHNIAPPSWIWIPHITNKLALITSQPWLMPFLKQKAASSIGHICRLHTSSSLVYFS